MNTKKRFYAYVIPSVFAFVLLGIYCFIDEFFVGNKVGDVGIATINIAFSYLALYCALGSGIGVGASVVYTITKEEKSEAEAVGYLGVANRMMLWATLLTGLPVLFFPKEILLLLGASEHIATIGVSYMQINAICAGFMIYAYGFSPIARNLGGATFVLIANTAGIVINIVMDWLFVWYLDWGLTGAALASASGQISAFILLIVYLGKHHSLFWSKRQVQLGGAVKRILGVGVSPFGLTVAPNVSIVLLNRACLKYGGDPALAAYGIISYLTYIVMIAMQGVGDGSQPLVSEYFGSHSEKNRKLVERMAYEMCFAIALFFMVFSWVTREQMGLFMGASKEVGVMIEKALPIFILAFPFSAYARTKASNLYSKERNLQSYIITYLDPIVVFLGTLVFPRFFGRNGVWFSSTFSQMVMALAAVFFR